MSKRKMCPASQLSAKKEGKYWIIGREVGESGTPHLQGYVSLRKRRTFVYVRDKLSNRCHLESSRGTARQNREYCIKGGNFVEGGSINEGRLSKDRDETARNFMVAVGRGDKGLVEFANSEPHTWIHHGSNMLRNALHLRAPLNVHQFQSGGSMELPEWASHV